MINTNTLRENDNDKNKSLNPHQYNEKRKSSQLSNNNIIVNYKPRGSTPRIEIDETKTSLIRATYNNLNIDTSKKQQRRRQDINKKFKSNISNNSNNNNNNSTEKKNSKDFILKNDNNNKSEKTCHLTFVFDPNGRFSYWIGVIVSLAFIYNFWIIIYRSSFNEITTQTQLYWMICDYTADFIYLIDILFNFHTGFLEEGVLQTDPLRIRHHYMNTTRFYIDCFCLLPLDILYLSFDFHSIFRCFRLVKVYKLFEFIERTERHFSYPNFFRAFILLLKIFMIFHLNACITHLLILNNYLSKDIFSNYYNYNNHHHHHQDNKTHLVNDYLKEIYSSIKQLTLVIAIPNPNTNADYLYAISEIVFAVIIFALIMGYVSNIVNNLENASKEFQYKFDAVKRYMSIRSVPNRLQSRVVKWFDFLWSTQKSGDDNQILNLLPYKLRAEIAIHVHLDTLKRVEIFQDTEAGFLNELVLRLKPVLFLPGDYICRKGEVGKEMYIVNSGKLQVISENGKIILATLKAGSYFGEISILNMGAHGNRRTASVKSVGYSDLFCLSKQDLWEVLKEYPAVRIKLEAIAVRRLEKHKKPLIEIVNLKRSKSMPNLESSMTSNTKTATSSTELLRRHGTLPTNLLKRTDMSLLYKKRSSIVKFKQIKSIAINNNNNNNLKAYADTKFNNNNDNNNENNNHHASKSDDRINKSVILELNPNNEIDTTTTTTNNNNTSQTNTTITNLLLKEIDELKKQIEYLKTENDILKRIN